MAGARISASAGARVAANAEARASSKETSGDTVRAGFADDFTKETINASASAAVTASSAYAAFFGCDTVSIRARIMASSTGSIRSWMTAWTDVSVIMMISLHLHENAYMIGIARSPAHLISFATSHSPPKLERRICLCNRSFSPQCGNITYPSLSGLQELQAELVPLPRCHVLALAPDGDLP